MSDWSEWSDCSHTCGSGQRFSSRRITKQAQGTGKPCKGGLRSILPCFLETCEVFGAIDCKWGDWGPLSNCSASCGGGDRSRRREIIREAAGGGLACAPHGSLEVIPCNTQPCAREACSWTLWSGWEPCTATCGGGQTKRRRNLAWINVDGKVLQSPQRLGSPALPTSLQYDSYAVAAASDATTQRSDAPQGFVAAHARGLCVLAFFGAASLFLLSAAGITELSHWASPLQRWSSSERWLWPLGLAEVTTSSSSLQASGGPALYAALGTEDPWDLSADDVETPAFRPLEVSASAFSS